MKQALLIIYFIPWLLVVLAHVAHIFAPKHYDDYLYTLRGMDEGKAKKQLMRTEGASLILGIILSWIGLFTSSWPIAAVLCVLLFLPANPFKGAAGYIWIVIRNLFIVIGIFVLIINMQFVHWTLHLGIASAHFNISLP